MQKMELSTVLARELGLCGAIVLLAACGPGGPRTSGDDEGAEQSSEHASEEDTEAQLPDVPPPEPMCTVEDYEGQAGVLDLLERVCVPLPEGELCPPCDDLCAYELSSCKGACLNHTVLCSEVVEQQCCHLITASESGAAFVPGRPLREHDAPLLPALVRTRTAGPRSPSADAYRELARCEQASVAAFVYCAELLAALDAPAELVARNLAAAREEQRHARLALRAAAALDGGAAKLGPTPRPRRALELRAFVEHLVRDGCLGEAAAAREASWALRQPGVSRSPQLRRFWQTVEREEAEHAALAWATLEFLLAQIPALAPVAQLAMREALDDWTQAGSELPLADRVDELELERLGLASAPTKLALLRETLALLGRAAQQRAARGAPRS